MTEEEWRTCGDPQQMLRYLWGRATDRQLRLFACGCVRRLWPVLPDARSRQAVETAEAYADGQALDADLSRARAAARAAYQAAGRTDSAPLAATYAAYAVAWEAARNAVWWAIRAAEAAAFPAEKTFSPSAAEAVRAAEAQAACDLLRDIVGNPVRPVAVAPAWLAWQEGTVRHLAEAIYQDRAWDRLAVLADALEMAGCDVPALILHLRGPGPHVRGCWAVDALLGKE